MGGRDALLGVVVEVVHMVLGGPLRHPRVGGRPHRLGHLHRVVVGVGGRVVRNMGLLVVVEWAESGRDGWRARRPSHDHHRRLGSPRVVWRLRGEPRRAYRGGEVGVSGVHERRGEKGRTGGPPRGSGGSWGAGRVGGAGD